MNGIQCSAALLLVALVCGLARARSDDKQASARKIEDLAWMAGDWETSATNIQIDEHWIHPSGGSMLGVSRTVAGEKTIFFEFLRLEARADGLHYVAQPLGRPGTDFPLVKLEGERAVFENLTHDFPKRILYWREGEGTLVARVEGDGTEKEKAQDYRYQRRKK